MPTYSYHCRKCGKRFELTEHMAAHDAMKHKCPKCHSKQTDQVMAPFFAKTSKKS